MQLRRLAARVRAAHQRNGCFVPAKYLPVHIDPANRANPYSLATAVLYDDGIVTVKCEKGFQWDGASIPALWMLAPWMFTLILHRLATMGYAPSWFAWLTTLALLVVTVRIAPYLQKMGRHVRAGCFHDRMYRLGEVRRTIADAIFLEMMRYDGVPLEARWLIYINVRLCGWRPYRRWAAARAASVQRSDEIK